MKRARLIYNPSAGREEVKKNLCKILDTLEFAGYETSAFATKGKRDASKEAQRASDAGFDLIISAGGDGTLYEVINGIGRAKRKPKLGILPFGTSNDFASSIGIPRQLDQALKILKKGETILADVGKANERFFINIAGGGALTSLTYEVPSKLKTVMGQMAYYIKGIEKITNIKPYRMKIEANDRILDEEFMLFLVANSNVVGGYKKFAPYASIHDGLMDVLLLKKCNLAELARVLSLVSKGGHIEDSKVIYFQTDKIKIDAPEEVLINLDGELGGTAPVTFEIVKECIEIIVNKDKMGND